MNIYIFSYFTFGVSIGFLSFDKFYFVFSANEAPEKMNSKYKIIEKEEVEFKRLKILCVIITSSKYHQTKAINIKKTWAKHCDKLMFTSTKTDTNLGAIGFDTSDDYNHVWAKIKLALQYVYDNFIDDYDWIYKGDDDTFAVIENMRYLLSSYSPQDRIYFGNRLKTPYHKYGYAQGGSGYVMSNAALRFFVEKILTNPSFCEIKTDTGSEDWNIGYCFNAGIYPADSRDPLKKETFLPFTPKQHLFPSFGKDFWYWSRHYYNSSLGFGSLSNYTIATHKIKPKYMYTLYYLTYHMQLFGVRRHFPPIRKKVLFDEVVKAT